MPGRRLLRTLGGRSRIEIISEEDHVKAREELRSLLMMEVDVISPIQKSSHRSIIHQEAVEDLKLLQRALVRYHRDLEELEDWSSRLYQDVGHTLSREERDDLKSLSAVRHQIKDEISHLEKSLREKYHSVVTSEEDQLLDGEDLWSPSLTQVMCEMVHLLREQTTLRTLLEELDSLDNPPTPPRSPNKGAEFAMDEGTTEEMDGRDLPLEISDLEDLTFPQVMTHRELVDELVRTRTDLRKMRSQARRDVATAIREAKDMEIGNLRAMVKQLREASLSTASFDSACSQ
ncbi:uncharacterized protein [Diadema setosum]|uniref:uncharacterized protein isoform X2 n=1 Tax=Diadema setosum TaxID=31175 RepID=UPI003B3B1288